MTRLLDRLPDLGRHLEHLRELRARVASADDLRSDLSLHNDVLFSLLAVYQAVVGIAGELCARHELRFLDYTEAVRNLSAIDGFSPDLVRALVKLPGFRNVLIHAYADLDLDRAVVAMRELEPIEEFVRVVSERIDPSRD